jgi:hypothetical protein
MKNSIRRCAGVLWLTSLLGLVVGCQTVYNTTMETVFGYEKRQLLKKAVISLQKEQQQTQVEFKDAMTRLKELYAFEGGDLEKTYHKLKASYDDCGAQAGDVHKRIENMEGIANSMFSEWEKELQQYSNPSMAEMSRTQLRETKDRYTQLSRTVRACEDTMKPVLAQLKDHVLFLKHNLNAAAIGSLKGEAAIIQGQIEALIAKMTTSIAEADKFIKTLPK